MSSYFVVFTKHAAQLIKKLDPQIRAFVYEVQEKSKEVIIHLVGTRETIYQMLKKLFK